MRVNDERGFGMMMDGMCCCQEMEMCMSTVHFPYAH